MASLLRGEELAYSTLDYIREHPEEWDQDSYFCGSTACFAGRVILLALGKSWRAYQNRGTGMSTGSLARELLGWTPEQADAVFRCWTDDFTVLELQVKRVLNGEI